MLPDRDLMANISSSPLHARLVAALKESGVAGALKQTGQFTLFAPTMPPGMTAARPALPAA